MKESHIRTAKFQFSISELRYIQVWMGGAAAICLDGSQNILGATYSSFKCKSAEEAELIGVKIARQLAIWNEDMLLVETLSVISNFQYFLYAFGRVDSLFIKLICYMG